MNDPQEFIERASKFLQQQREMFGDFSIGNLEMNISTSESQKQNEVEKKATATSNKVEEPDGEYDSTSNEITPKKEEKAETLTPSQRIANCTTLEELRALCEETDALKTDLEGTNLVFGVGNPDADLMIVGEAPGYNEDQQGEPFVGQAGQLLDKIMAAINFNREDIYIANILKHRPPNNRDPKAEERQRSLPYLLRQIEIIDPKLILAVGRVSATTLLGKETSLGSLRQKFHPFHGRELMATYHPAALLRNQQWKRPTWEDVQMLRKRYDELVGE